MTLLLVYRLLRRMNLLAVRDLETCSFVIFEYIYSCNGISHEGKGGRVYEARKRFLPGNAFFSLFPPTNLCRPARLLKIVIIIRGVGRGGEVFYNVTTIGERLR